jgi:hypothetical protein
VRDDAYRRNYQAFELDPGEVVSQSWVASQGMLVVTNQRLLYEPIRTPKNLIEPAASFLGQAPLGKLIAGAIDLSGGLKQPWSVALNEIATVEPIEDTGLRLGLISGETRELEISRSLWSTRFSSANTAARNEALAAIRAAITGAVASRASHDPPQAMSSFFVGTWRVTGLPQPGDRGALQVAADGSFSARLVFFGALPDGSTWEGRWWLVHPPVAVALQGRVDEPRADVVFPFSVTVGGFQFSAEGFAGEAVENGLGTVTFARV